MTISITLWAGNLIPTAVTIVTDPDTGYSHREVTFEAETFEDLSVDGDVPGSHFYQRATDNGFSVSRVVGEVFALNLLLAALAIGSAMTPSAATAVLLLIVGGIAYVVFRIVSPDTARRLRSKWSGNSIDKY